MYSSTVTTKMHSVNCHKLVYATALDMAASLYDDVMHDNRLYVGWKRMCPELTPGILANQFIDLLAPKLVEKARASLVGLLSLPHIPEDQKKIIYEALILDEGLRRGRSRAERRRAKRRQRIRLDG